MSGRAHNRRAGIDDFNTEIHKRLLHSRVFCVSAENDNVVMCSHYADQHRGIVFRLAWIDALDNRLLAAREVTRGWFQGARPGRAPLGPPAARRASRSRGSGLAPAEDGLVREQRPQMAPGLVLNSGPYGCSSARRGPATLAKCHGAISGGRTSRSRPRIRCCIANLDRWRADKEALFMRLYVR